ncbi:DUF4011 domain-containing protein [Sabulicella glaciei]|uniref:DUF4011 domain-containing protein n=1 Tax=Sabulicella glaciei TaxID=2984948 RepID=A0ABT3P0I4_9PROT|nr:DUF4011 domain-containing protein [Roseococcus sp. MDT2-1-1]MCW8087901.1 DUF4011 domain-containing protein [Roseococcus sp. MDT2-1-1]
MTIAPALEEARRALLDLSTRNRMLSLPGEARGRRVLRLEGNPAAILARLESGDAIAFGPSAPFRSPLPAKELEARLRAIAADARSAREETGVASLFLAFGTLHWRDTRTPEREREAPLAFLPVTLTREGVSSRFRLRLAPGEAQENLPLREKFARELRRELPPFDPAAPLVWAGLLAPHLPEGWRVEEGSIVLGLFGHARFLMWRDLDPALHPGLLSHAPLRRLLDPTPPAEAPPFEDDSDVDAAIPVERLDHVVPVDGSQALAAEAARRGGDLVIQGPPGTGKSQTIVNILAQAILDGRSVLFVAEKAAALEVVQRRLAALGLAPAILALHDEDTGPRAVLDALRDALATPRPEPMDREAAVARLGDLRGRLNRHAAAMRDRVGGLPVHEVAQRLALLRQEGPAPPFRLGGAEGWDPARRDALREAVPTLAERAEAARGPWAGTAPAEALPPLPSLIRRLAAAPGTVEEALRAEAAGAPPLPAEILPEVRALLADLETIARARADARIASLDMPGVEEAAARLARPGGLLGFLDGERRAAGRVLDAALRDPAALPALLAAREAARRVAASSLPRDAATLRTALDWHTAHGATPPLDDTARDALAAARDACSALGLPLSGRFGDLAARLATLAAETDALPRWRLWLRAREAAPELAPLADALAGGALPPERAEAAFERALLEALWRAALRAHPELAAFDGAAMDRLVESFQAADAARVRLARHEALLRHAERAAALRGGAEPASMGFLRGEMERRRGHAPVRTLLARGSAALRMLKPVLMMSPLSVARFLANPHHATQPGFPLFDLVVMDEASQIEPVDALGAIARGRHFAVVGDDRQMPPTRFFRRVTEEEDEAEAEEDEAEGPAARDVESILGLAAARGVPNALLRWHYRSRHESLIATSNAEFYGGRLLVLPSPLPRSPALGLTLVRVEGRFRTGVNAEEAQAVAEAAMRHARETPGESLGIAAFGIGQRDAILTTLEALRRDSPETEAFFTAHPHEPFFVKNLENVQGDERDAMLISVGYGRDADGRLALRFGPLATEGGERRLNVLITRARRRCVVFTGLAPEEIDLSRAGGRGVAALRAFLQFAASADEAKQGEAADTPLGALVGPVLRANGLEPVSGVGAGQLRVDVAARRDGRFEWGIESDGADWSGLRSARDRSNGWTEALKSMGWRLASSWTLDWLDRPREAEERLRDALGLAAAEEAAPAPDDAGLAESYAEASPHLDAPLDAMPFARLAEAAAEVVAIEAPMPEEALAERLRLARGEAPLSAAERAALVQALRLARSLHGLREEGGFWFGEAAPDFRPRDRRAALPALRRAAALHPRELEAAARTLLEARPMTTEAEAALGIVRMLGLESGAEAAIEARLALLAGSGTLRFPG